MKIFPAIDIEDGHCVRLQQGRKENLTVYGDDPVKMALKWQEEGAKALHVVDLDGAFKGDGVNKEIIRKMCEALAIPIEVGGGIRSEKAIKDYLDMGVYRVIIGSKAAASPYFAIQAAKTYGSGHIAVSIDAKGDEVATHGWVDGSSRKVMTFAETLLTHGVNTLIYTDISRDGMLTGCNVEATAELASQLSIPVIASGGIRDLDDIRKLLAVEDDGVTMAILGRSLYEGTLDFTQALDLVEATEAAKDNQANNEG